MAPDGTVTRLARSYGYPTHLADDGQRLVTTRDRRDPTSTITVRSASTGAPIAKRTFRGYVEALDVDGDRVLIGGKRTILWRTDVDTHDVLSGDSGYDGDLSADVVAGFDPSTDTAEGACTRIMRVSTGKVVTTMCDDLVLEFNADATLMATTGRYLDGPISVIRARTLDGRVLARYRVLAADDHQRLPLGDSDRTARRRSRRAPLRHRPVHRHPLRARRAPAAVPVRRCNQTPRPRVSSPDGPQRP